MPVQISLPDLLAVPMPDIQRLLEAHGQPGATSTCNAPETFNSFIELVSETCIRLDPDIDSQIPIECMHSEDGLGCWGEARDVSGHMSILIRFNMAGLGELIEVLAHELRHIGQYVRETCSGTDDPLVPTDYIERPEEIDAIEFGKMVCSELTGPLVTAGV
jgi:hypothetical protein